MNKLFRLSCLAPCLAWFVALTPMASHAGDRNALRSPAPGVLCDRYLCADEKGVSQGLTKKYLGERAATRLFSQGEFDVKQFTFSNGVFCDVTDRLCRENRYFGTDGKRSGAMSKKYTAILFGR